MLYDLRRADVRVKWLVTGLLATLGLSYVFGAAMVALYAGFTPQSVAATYAGAEMSMLMPPETTMVVQRPMSRSKSTRLNSSHVRISYAVFCLKKKNKRLHSVLEHSTEFRRTHAASGHRQHLP